MIKKWICKVKYETIDEKTGKEITVNTPYLFEAVNYGHAEKRAHEEMERLVRGAFNVKDIRKANYTDLFLNEAGHFYHSKISFVSFTESGKQKFVSNQMLVTAENIKQAYDIIEKQLEGMTVEFVINEIKESPIEDFFPYESSLEKQEENYDD